MLLSKKIIGYGILIVGYLVVPLLPFSILILFPFIAMLFGTPVMALLFSALLDLTLVPAGAPMWISLTFWSILLLPIYGYLRYSTTV